MSMISEGEEEYGCLGTMRIVISSMLLIGTRANHNVQTDTLTATTIAIGETRFDWQMHDMRFL